MKNILPSLFFITTVINTFSQDQRAELIFDDGEILEGFGMITKNDKIKFRIEDIVNEYNIYCSDD